MLPSMLIRLRILRPTPQTTIITHDLEDDKGMDFTALWGSLVSSLTGVTLVFLFIFALVWTIYNCLEREQSHVDPSSLRLFSRSEWNGFFVKSPELAEPAIDEENPAVPKFVAKRAVIIQIETDVCFNPITCSKIIKEVKKKAQKPLGFNFLITPNAYTYEALGFDGLSPLYPELCAITIGIMGSLENGPNYYQLLQVDALLKESVELGYLHRSYTIVGKVDKEGDNPTRLFDNLRRRPEFDSELSDRY